MPSSVLSEPTLIERARRGDVDAFSSLVEAHSGRVYRTLRGLSLEPDEAEEVAQEVFVRAWRGLRQFEGRAQLSTWLYRIAYNEAQRRLARRPSSAISPGYAPEEALRDVPDNPQGGPDARALDREFESILAQALRELPHERRVAVVLRDIEGLSTEEAASVVGIRQAAFKSRLHRGRMQLRELLEPYLDLA
ncbi:MAG: sigma-70 family RNA polymerase sigma factor [Solirubrobacterales bacterium]|nr:sigma-70 family RNA polymerase sigma factor [Solirubrobacterales bacterium]